MAAGATPATSGNSGDARDSSIDHQNECGQSRSNAETKPRRTTSAGAAEATGNVAGDHRGRRRTSGEGGFGATGHQNVRGSRLQVAGDAAHPMEQAAGAGMAGGAPTMSKCGDGGFGRGRGSR